MSTETNKLSIIAPALNEEKNIEAFCKRTRKAGKDSGLSFEIVVIDDGSTDSTFSKLIELKSSISELTVIKFRRNFGLIAALKAGLSQSSGDTIFIFDTDMQHDPVELLPILLREIRAGHDVVSGRKTKRKHLFVYRWMAWVGYILYKRVLGTPFHDTSYSPNAYRRYVFANLNLYGEMHRFLVPLCYWRGYKVTEVAVPHHARESGSSKFTPWKGFRAFMDMFIVKFWIGYSLRPIHLFGGIGLLLSGIGFLVGLYVFYLTTVMERSELAGSPLPLFSVFLIVTGLQFFLSGILADMIAKTYFKDAPTYDIEKIV